MKGGTIIDLNNFGLSSKDISNSVVVVKDGKIVAAGPANMTKIPAGANIIDVAGKYIVPGLIDGFGSVTNQAFANAYLYMGVTSVVTVEDNRRGKTFSSGNPSPALYKQDAYWGADRVESKNPAFRFENINYRNDSQIKYEIDSMSKAGARVMLIHYGVKPDQLKAILAACNANNLATVGELGFSFYSEGVQAGIQSFLHTTRYTADILPDSVRAVYSNAPFGPPASFYYEYITKTSVLKDPKFLKLATLFTQNTVELMPTGSLQVYNYMPFSSNPWKEEAAVLISEKDIVHEPLDRETGKHKNPPPIRAKVAPVLFSIDSFLVTKGARYLTGSGATAFGTLPGISLHTELGVLSHTGLTNRQVFAAATNNFSLLWKWTHIGKIEAGRDADILVLSRNPLEDVAHLKKIDKLILKGKLIDRKQLIQKP